MLRRVQKYIRYNELLQRGDRVLVCVSGGADSVALLDVLVRGGYECVAAHCNFHLRGDESNRDETFVRTLAAKMNVPVAVTHFDTQAYAADNHLSMEMAARELRYGWFAEVAKRQQCKAIAVAHHQNDQAETVVMNLLRGTGIRGLCGMRPKSDNPVTADSVPVIRPLLCTTRDYIEHYLRDIRQMEWVTDSTNADTAIRRNAIREQLSHCSKAEIEHIAATAESMQGYVDWLEKKETRAKGRVELYEQLRPYHYPQTDEIYDALMRGEGGKVFYSPTHKAEIRHRQVKITPLQKGEQV